MSSPFLDVIGPEYMDSAFVWARRADPDARLCYNESSADGPGARADLMYGLVTDLLGRGVPLDCVGFQMHLIVGDSPAAADIRSNIQRFADLGLGIRISEMDVRMELPATAAKLEEQARIYRETLEAVLQIPAVESITVWGFTDKLSWILEVFPGFGAAHLWDENYQKKPAYYGVIDALLNG
jgi:endo-1,4-beta-xylanase